MATILQLISATEDFFNKHWDKNSTTNPPKWSDAWKFFHSIPGNDSRGCYVHLVGDEVVYVGVALNKGLAGYQNHSLGVRLRNYWNVDRSKKKVDGMTFYKPKKALQDRGVDSIMTLSFPEQAYLAMALEFFLIQNLTPNHNSRYK